MNKVMRNKVVSTLKGYAKEKSLQTGTPKAIIYKEMMRLYKAGEITLK